MLTMFFFLLAYALVTNPAEFGRYFLGLLSRPGGSWKGIVGFGVLLISAALGVLWSAQVYLDLRGWIIGAVVRAGLERR
jgi:hypothetical protein